jgi:Protein of unknown function (DUF3592)
MTPATRANSFDSSVIRQHLGRILVILILITFGTLIVTKSIPSIAGGLQTQTWKATTGTVLESRWLTHHATGNGYDQYHEGKGYRHTPEITYSYSVDGHGFVSRRYQFGDTRMQHVDEVQNILIRYPVKRVVRVTYNPSDPSQSVLVTGVEAASWYMMAFGLALVALGIAFWRNVNWYERFVSQKTNWR